MRDIEISKVILRNDKGRFLAVKNKDSGNWELPGGKIEDDEGRFEAAKREIIEETELKISGLEDIVRIELEDENQVNCYMVYSDQFEGQIETSNEISDYRWVDYNEAEELEWHRDSTYNLPVLRYLQKYLSSERDYGSGKVISVIKALIQNQEGKFLAVRKSNINKISSSQEFKKYGEMSGKWELPGGRIGKTREENRFEAAKRELEEELSIKVESGTDIVREKIEENNIVDVYIVLYRHRDWKGSINLSEEHSELKWVEPDEYLHLDWHKDAGYGYPPMKFLKDYLKMDLNYRE